VCAFAAAPAASSLFFEIMMKQKSCRRLQTNFSLPIGRKFFSFPEIIIMLDSDSSFVLL
jgi:hypothetical protein